MRLTRSDAAAAIIATDDGKMPMPRRAFVRQPADCCHVYLFCRLYRQKVVESAATEFRFMFKDVTEVTARQIHAIEGASSSIPGK